MRLKGVCAVKLVLLVVFIFVISGMLPSAVADDAAGAKPRKTQKYLDLRFDEDYSYLDGPADSYDPDFFDPIKNIHLDEDWRLSIGGEIKGRWESFDNLGFGAPPVNDDSVFLHRYMLHTDVKYKKLLRVFFQGITAFVEDRDSGPRPIDENRWDIQQLFLDLRFLGEDVPLTLRFGRQDLNYGSARLISTLDWANTRRRFDGVKVFWTDDTWDIDMFYVKPTPVNLAKGMNRKPDRYDHDTDFYGLWVTYKAMPKHGIEGYFLAYDGTGPATNANGRMGDRCVYTLGGRFWGKPAPWDYELEAAGQLGSFAGDSVRAWMLSAVLGYTVPQFPWQTRIGLGFDYASGDNDPGDRTHGTFFQHFPFGHAYLGFIDLVGRQNIIAARADLSMKPCKNVKFKLTYHTFCRASDTDALYNAGGGIVRGGGLAGDNSIGHELDATLAYKLNRHTSFLFGWSHLWPGGYIQNSGASKDVDLLYMQYVYKF